MTQPSSSFEVRPLTSADWPALAALFESDAECNDCWCMNHRLPPERVVSGPAARAALQARIEAGSVQALLAWSGDRAIGWCGLERRAELPGHDATYPLPPEHDGIWTIHCFFIQRDFRGRGAARALLQAAVERARDLGARTLEAYPTEPGPDHPIFDFAGPWQLYQQTGFRPETRINSFYTRVVRQLIIDN